MTISKECTNLLENLTEEYAQKGQRDRDYKLILSLLKEFQLTLIGNRKQYNDDRVIAYLSNTAVIAEKNPMFRELQRLFLVSYLQQTRALDSMFEPDLKIKSELDESWGAKLTKQVQPEAHSLFFIELQQALAKRAARIATATSQGLDTPNFKS